MPELPTHEFMTKVIFGASFTEIHKLLDYPSSLYGKGHRILYHDKGNYYCLQKRFKDPRVYPVCPFHIFLDYHRDALKLETLAEVDQFSEAELLVRRIYSEMKRKEGLLEQEKVIDEGMPADIKTELEKQERLVQEIRRLNREDRGRHRKPHN